MKYFERFFVFIIPLVFLVIGLLTVYDYGMNWDSPVHFARGQAYLHYIFTGKTNYNDLPKFCLNEYNLNSRKDATTGEICDRHRNVRVSEYESPLLDFNSWVATATYGHPAFSDIMLALSNNIFYKYLGWVEDLNSYHLYSIFTTFLLALIVSVWTKQTFGKFASVIAVLTLYGFPLLFAESHFNVKDPPMAAFFTIALYFFWLAIVQKKPMYLLVSALAGGASFGTKLNFAFAPIILFPWALIYSINNKFNFLSRKMIIMLLLYPIIVFLVFFVSWPALWPDPIIKIQEYINFYKDIGGSNCQYFYFTPGWFTTCTQTITLKYILYTLPIFSLFLTFFGTLFCLKNIKDRKFVAILWLTLLLFTIGRVTFSLTSIYGGLRQILEFSGPFAMVAGVGAFYSRNLLVSALKRVLPHKTKAITTGVSFVIILGCSLIYWQMYKIHPYENVYFNSLIGGLKGAQEQDFPGFGSTYGSITIQGVDWLNKHTEKYAKLALVSGNAQNISRSTLREDIDISNSSRSGYNLEGEYLIMSVVGQDIFQSTFKYQYLNKYLKPVYEIKIDGVPLLKIWKNDKDHLQDGILANDITKLIKSDFRIENEKISEEFGHKNILLSLSENMSLKALGLTFVKPECKEQLFGARIEVSPDGIEYTTKADNINGFTDREIFGFGADLVYLFTGESVQKIMITPPITFQCKPNDIKFSVFTFN